MDILFNILYLAFAIIIALAISSRTKRPSMEKGEIYTPPKKNKSKMEMVLIFFSFAVPVFFCLWFLFVLWIIVMS